MITFDASTSQGFAELQGIDPLAHARVILGREEAEGPFARLGEGGARGREGIVLGAGLAAKLGVIEGDLVRALVPSVTLTPWGATARSRVYEVVGSYRSDHFQEDALRAYIEIESARSLRRAPGASSWIELRLEDLGQLEAMKERLSAAAADVRQVLPVCEKYEIPLAFENHQDLTTEELLTLIELIGSEWVVLLEHWV